VILSIQNSELNGPHRSRYQKSSSIFRCGMTLFEVELRVTFGYALEAYELQTLEMELSPDDLTIVRSNDFRDWVLLRPIWLY
jgi:hypothetical protein